MNTPFLDGICKEAGIIPWHLLAKPAAMPIGTGIIGGGLGALADKDNRIRGALLGSIVGAGLGYSGSTLLRNTARGKEMVSDSIMSSLGRAAKRARHSKIPGIEHATFPNPL